MRAIVFLTSVLLATACGGSSDESPLADQSRSPGAEASSAASSSAASSPSADAPTSTPFGSTYTFKSGVRVTVAPPRRLARTPKTSGCSEQASPTSTLLAFDITINNGTSQPYQQGRQIAELSNDGAVVKSFCDETHKIDVAPLKDIPPGGSSKFAFGYQVEARGALEMTFPEVGTNEKAVFTGK